MENVKSAKYQNLGQEQQKAWENPLEKTEQINQLYKKAEAEMDAARPNLRDFREVYSLREIEEDIQKEKELEKKFEKGRQGNAHAEQTKKISTITEYLIFKNFAQWTNNRGHVYLASKYDDYIKSTDLILRCRPEEEISEINIYHAMKIDVVLGSIEKFMGKLVEIINSIDAYDESLGEEPMSVKYFRPDQEKIHASFVHGVISFSRGTVINLVSKEFSENALGIQNDQAPFMIMTQLREQYQGFMEYAEYRGKTKLADKYREALADVNNVFRDLIITVKNVPRLKMKVDDNESVKNMRKFFQYLREDYMGEDRNDSP